jgi:hypothetical protein
MRIYLFLLILSVFVACKTENSSESNISIQTTHNFDDAYLNVLVNGQSKHESQVKGKYDNINLGYFPSNTQFSAQLKKSQTDSAGWVKFLWFKTNTIVKQDSIYLEMSDTLGVSEYLN